jgi:carbonic anhydrase/acetyltransferase-like protein (isoleucine patch superfamily)
MSQLKKGRKLNLIFYPESNQFNSFRVVIENCIICDKAVIKSGSVLKNCLVGCNFVVQENTTVEKAHLTGEGFMEI